MEGGVSQYGFSRLEDLVRSIHETLVDRRTANWNIAD